MHKHSNVSFLNLLTTPLGFVERESSVGYRRVIVSEAYGSVESAKHLKYFKYLK